MSMTDVDKRKLDIGRVFGDTFGVVRRRGLLLLGVTFAAQILSWLVVGLLTGGLVFAAMTSPSNPFAMFSSPAYWFALAIGLMLGMFVLACQLQITITDLEGSSPNLAEVLQVALRKFLPLLLATILLFLGVWLASIFFLIPGIILGMMWAVTLPAVVGETSDVFRAFGRSRALTRGNRWRIFGLLLVVLLMAIIFDGFIFLLRGGGFAGAGRLDLSSPMAMVGMLITLVFGIAISILWSVGSGALYVQLRELKGMGGEAVAQVFS